MKRFVFNAINAAKLCGFAFGMIILLALGTGVSHATPIMVLEENFDGLPLGSIVPGWIAVNPNKDSTLPVVQNVSFKSAPHGAQIANDFDVVIPFNPIEGIVTIEIWMNPKVGSDTNNFLRLGLEGLGVNQVLTGKNDSDRWLYTKNAAQVFFTPVDGQGHDIRIVYNTFTGTYDFFFDEGLIDSNIPLNPGAVENRHVDGIGLNSGRGGGATTSYFDNLRVSVNPIPEPSTLVLFVIGVLGIVGYGWRRRKQARQ